MTVNLAWLILLLVLQVTPGASWRLDTSTRAAVRTRTRGLFQIKSQAPANRESFGYWPARGKKGNTNKLFKMASTDGVVIDTSEQRGKVLSYSRLAFRCTVISWWIQIILTVISSVILTFANTVRQSSNAQSFWTSGFAFSSIGVIISYASALLTWKNSRMCRKLVVATDEVKAKLGLKKDFQFSITLSLVGMFVTLLGAEQIVGTLASKVLSLQGIQPIIGTIGAQNSLQALDIFLVQANTNTLFALFSPIVCYLLLQTSSYLKGIGDE